MVEVSNDAVLSPNQWIDSLGLQSEQYTEHLRRLLNNARKSAFELDDWTLAQKELRHDLHPHPPLRLEDRHISSQLALQHVVLSSSLLADLQKAFCPQFKDFISANGLPELTYNFPRAIVKPGAVSNAQELMSQYYNNIGCAASRYASRLHIDPKAESWPSFVNYVPRSPAAEYFLFECALPVRVPQALPVHGIKPDVNSSIGLNIGKYSDTKDFQRSTPCTFMLFPPTQEGEDIVDKSLLHSFKTTFATTYLLEPLGPRQKEYRTHDWEGAFWSKYFSCAELYKTPPKPSQSPPQKACIWVSGRSGQRSSEDRPRVAHFVQRAWNTAVENDATFIVLSNGNTQRIGVRHRATNTLFLSDILELQNESYSLIQIALFSAIVQDGLNRDSTQIFLSSRKKERLDPGQARQPSPKKQKVIHTRVLPENFDEEIARRPVILLTFNLGVFHSHKASAFLRTKTSCAIKPTSSSLTSEPEGGRFYPVSDCINIEVGEIAGSGRQCRIYRGTAKILSDSDSSTIVEGPVILKASYASYLNAALLKEYQVYSTLQGAGVREGIPKVHGLFEDPETGVAMLLMADLGRQTLQDRKHKEGDRFPRITEDEFKTLRSVIRSINGAGILHNDIKPNNIVFDEDGKPYIIDFGISVSTTDLELYPKSEDDDPPWSKIDPYALSIVEADSSGVRSFDVETIEDLFIGRFEQDRRYPYF